MTAVQVVTTVVEGSRRARSLTELSTGFTESNTSDEKADLPEFVNHSLSKLGLIIHTPITNGTSTPKPDSAGLVRREHEGLSNGSIDGLTERSYLGITTLATLSKKRSIDRPFVIAFLLHMVLIGEMSLSGRRLQPINIERQAHADGFLGALCLEACKILRTSQWRRIMETNSIPCDVIDAVDGRLFVAVLHSLRTIFDVVMSESRLASQFSRLAQALALAYSEVDTSNKALPPDQSDAIGKKSRVLSPFSKPSILPFTSPIFDKHLSSIHISVAGSRPPRPESARIFQEVTHWHNAKRKLDAKASKELSGKEKGRALRRNQFFMAEMLSYAASLTNAAGKSLEPETIVVGEPKKATAKMLEASKENESKAKTNKNPGSKAGSNRKNVGKQAMLSNIAASKAAKEEDASEKTLMAWETARKIFDSETLPVSRYLKARGYLNGISDAKRKVVEAEVEFYKICVLLSIYRDMSKAKDGKERAHDEHLFGVASLLWDSLRKLPLSGGLTKAIVDSGKDIVMSLGLPPVVFPAVESTRPPSFKPTIPLSNLPKLPLSSSPKDFQLLYCGPYMDRNLDSAPDSRVPFEPDGWQRKVLDELDADKSIFVVAPTSAGKTFISFYAMERILRADNDSVLVYVAPTKALVNQIAAEIQV